MISALILNWQRPYNLQNIILPILEKCSRIDEIIISHGREDTVFDYKSGHCHLVHRHDYGNVNREYGMARRFLAYDDARKGIILSLDGDIVIPESSLSALCEEFAQAPGLIHSLYGGNPDGKLRYTANMQFGEAAYAIVCAASLPKRLSNLFFEYAPLAAGLAKYKPWPFWEVEDLFMSLVAIKTNWRLNRAYPFQRVELRIRGQEAPPAISDSVTHLRERSLFRNSPSRRWESATWSRLLPVTRPGAASRCLWADCCAEISIPDLNHVRVGYWRVWPLGSGCNP